MRWIPSLGALLLTGGCSTGEPAGPLTTLPPPAAPIDLTTTNGGPSNDRNYYVAWQPEPDPIPIGEVFALKLWILEGPAGGAIVNGVDVRVSAWMPDHDKWMQRDPDVAPLDAGHFAAKGMLFPMAGRWELYVDVTRDGLTERGQYLLRVE